MRSNRQLKVQWTRQQAAAENRHRAAIERALNTQLKAFITYADANGLDAALTLIDTIVTPDPLHPVIQRLYIAEGTRAGLAEQRELNREYGDEYQSQKAFDFFTSWVTEMTNYFYSYGMQAITKMTETTKNSIRQEVSSSLSRQESYPEIRNNLASTIPGVDKRRANVIARTETVSAMSYGKQTAAASLPFQMIKGWISIRDKRTRHSHVRMDGEKVPLAQPYSNDGMYPGDPDLPGKERIQCRCTETYTPLRDANGRPVRK